MNFYPHIWKSFLRNAQWRRNLLTKILLGVLILYFTGLFLMLGLNIDKILGEGGGDPVEKFNSVLLWYFVFDLTLRCLMQQLPAIEALPYLRLRIRRSTIINYLLIRSMINLFNLIPWFIVIPFSVKILLPQYGTTTVLFYISGFCLVMILNNFLAVLTRYLINKISAFYVLPFILPALVSILKKWGISTGSLSAGFLSKIMHGNSFVFAILLLTITLVIYATYRLLYLNFYIDGIRSERERKGLFGLSRRGPYRRFGDTGRYLSLEISLLVRNKRPRQMLIIVPVFLAYFLFTMLKTNNFHDQFFLLMMVTMLTGIGASMYGQFMFSWESSYFDCIMARKNNFMNYVKAKYYFMSGLSLITFIPLIIVFSVTKLIDPFLACSVLLFITGVNSFIIMFFATFNDGRIDLTKNRMFNYQGVGSNQFILTAVFMLLPVGIYTLFKKLINPAAGELALAVPGITFIIFHAFWIRKIIIPLFYNRKYKNLEGFRKLSF